jgi:hypothetical protein
MQEDDLAVLIEERRRRKVTIVQGLGQAAGGVVDAGQVEAVISDDLDGTISGDLAGIGLVIGVTRQGVMVVIQGDMFVAGARLIGGEMPERGVANGDGTLDGIVGAPIEKLEPAGQLLLGERGVGDGLERNQTLGRGGVQGEELG